MFKREIKKLKKKSHVSRYLWSASMFILVCEKHVQKKTTTDLEFDKLDELKKRIHKMSLLCRSIPLRNVTLKFVLSESHLVASSFSPIIRNASHLRGGGGGGDRRRRNSDSKKFNLQQKFSGNVLILVKNISPYSHFITRLTLIK
jgi:hypothetical protein